MNLRKNVFSLGAVTAALCLAVSMPAEVDQGMVSQENSSEDTFVPAARPTPPATRPLDPSAARQRGQESGAPAMVRTDPRQLIQNSSDLMGQEVVTEDGQHLGTVEDVIIDVNTGQAEFIAVGPEPSLRAVPPQAFRPQADEGLLILDIETDRWERAPTMERQELTRLARERNARRVYRHYGLDRREYAGPMDRGATREFGSPDRSPYQRRMEPDRFPGDPAFPREQPRAFHRDSPEVHPEVRREREFGAPHDREQPAPRDLDAPTEFGARDLRRSPGPALQNPRFHHSHRGSQRDPDQGWEETSREFGDPAIRRTQVPASERLQWVSSLIDQQATNREGETIGELSDFIVDLHRGQVQHVIVSYDQPEWQQFALPVQDVEIDQDRRVIVRPDAEGLQEAPLYDEREARLQPGQAFRYQQPEAAEFGAPEHDPSNDRRL